MINIEFENPGMGKCVILKESTTPYTLVYSILGKEFIIVADLDLKTGSWLLGSYFGNDLDSALSFFNKKTEIEKER